MSTNIRPLHKRISVRRVEDLGSLFQRAEKSNDALAVLK